MRLADEILLLLTDDTTGAMSVPEAELDRAVAAAALVDLEAEGLAAVSDLDGPAPDGSGRTVDDGSVCLTPDSTRAVADPVAAAAVDAYRGLQGTPLADCLPILGRAVYPAVHRALAADGVLRRESHGTASMRPATTWPTVDAAPERRTRSLLHHVIAGEDVTGEQRRHAKTVVVLLEAAGVLDAALSDLDEQHREIASHTEPPVDASPVFAAVVRALKGDPTV